PLVFFLWALLPFVHFARRAAGGANHLVEVPGRLAAVAEFGAVVLDQLDQVRIAQQGLGGYAAPVQADPAQLFALDAEHLLFELGGADRASVARGSAAN